MTASTPLPFSPSHPTHFGRHHARRGYPDRYPTGMNGRGEGTLGPRWYIRRLLLTAVAILGVWLVFVTTTPVMVYHFTRPKAEPPLTTAALRSFAVFATASGVLQLGSANVFAASAPFTQTEVVQLQVGQAATVSVDAIMGLTLPAKVSSIDPSATAVNGVPEYFATITLTSTDQRLRDGQTATLAVVTATASNVLAVPTQALFTNSAGALQVDVWSSGQAYATTVSIGLVGNTLTQITSGLVQGEQVMLAPGGAAGILLTAETRRPPASASAGGTPRGLALEAGHARPLTDGQRRNPQ